MEYKIVTVETLDGLVIHHRENTSDIKAIKEACAKVPGDVKKTSSYERVKKAPIFKIEAGDIWLDCGAQIGSFTLRALKNGASHVISVEPEDSSRQLFEKNVAENGYTEKVTLENCAIVPEPVPGGTLTLHLTKSTYRHTLVDTGKGIGQQTVRAVPLRDLLQKYPQVNACKLDIEGNEKGVLQSVDWRGTNVNKLVFEYSLDLYPELSDFHDLLDWLKEHFTTVYYRNSLPPRGAVWDTKKTRGANGWLVWCLR